MSVLTLGYNFESRLSDVNIKKYIFNIIKGRLTSYNEGLKKLLTEIDCEFQLDKQILTDIQTLNFDELTLLKQKIKKFNDHFDKVNNLYYDKNYFEDLELKQLFTSISRQAHKIENTSHKYLYLSQISAKTPDYIKNGLADLSKENTGKKLIARN